MMMTALEDELGIERFREKLMVGIVDLGEQCIAAVDPPQCVWAESWAAQLGVFTRRPFPN
jgi:hypothetical protein